jgi:hypothetical protein
MQDGRFTVSTPADSASLMRHSHVRVDVSFLLRCQASQPVQRTAILRVSGVSSIPKGSKATHQLTSPQPKTSIRPINIAQTRKFNIVQQGTDTVSAHSTCSDTKGCLVLLVLCSTTSQPAIPLRCITKNRAVYKAPKKMMSKGNTLFFLN